MELLSSVSLLAYGIFVCIQLFQPTRKDMGYYVRQQEQHRAGLVWDAYVPVFVIVFTCLAVSLWLLSMAEEPWLLVLVVAELVLDKLWFGAYFRLRSKAACVVCALCTLSLAVAITTVAGVWQQYVAMALHLPFCLLQVHVLVFSLTI